MPPFIEFAVIRQKHLGHDAEQASAMDDDAAIVEMPAVPQRRADDKHREEVAACREQPIDLPLDLVEHGVLEQQIVDRIGRKPELGEHHQGDPGLVAGRRGDRGYCRHSAAGRRPRHAGRRRRPGRIRGCRAKRTRPFVLLPRRISRSRSTGFQHRPDHRNDPEHGQAAKHQQHRVGGADQAVADIADGIAGK